MKKLSERHRLFLIRKSVNGNRPYLCQGYGSMVLRKFSQHEAPKARLYFRQGRAILVAPEKFNLSQNSGEILHFLRFLRYVASTGIKLYVDFTKIKEMSPLCAMLLTSELDRWRKFGIGKRRLRVVDAENWSPVVKELLSQMGFSSFLGVDTIYSDPSSNIKYLQLQSGTYGDAQIAENISENLSRISGEIEHSNLLHEGLTEAMINSKKWAYSASVPDEYRRWWVCGSYNCNSNLSTVMIYDHGIGIPKTIPTSGLFEFYKKIIENWGIIKIDDAYWIKAAMNVGRTASGLGHRGKGLRDIQQFILSTKTGVLRIISGQGEYILQSDGTEQIKNHPIPLSGTLIAWQIEVKKQNEEFYN